jgi:hypothetical protein
VEGKLTLRILSSEYHGNARNKNNARRDLGHLQKRDAINISGFP